MGILTRLFYQIAQISTGIEWADPILNNIFLEYGAITTMIAVVMIFVAITMHNQNKRADENEKFVLDTAKNGQETKDELIKVKDAFSTFQIESAKKEGVFEGQILELSKTVKHNQDKYEEKEKIWETEKQQLKAELATLREQSEANKAELEKLQEELNGKKSELQSVTLERDLLKVQAADLEREKLDLQLERDRMKVLILEQENAIKALKEELDKRKLEILIPPEPDTPISAVATTPQDPLSDEAKKEESNEPPA